MAKTAVEQSKQLTGKIQKILEDGKLAEMFAAQGAAGRGDLQLLSALAAEHIIVGMGWRWGITNYDSFINEMKAKYERYGKNLNPFTDRQREWTISFLSEQYRRAAERIA